MLYQLAIYLTQSLGLEGAQILTYYSARMLFAALTSLLVSILCGPWFIRKLSRLNIGQTIRKKECPELGKLHAGKKNTPTMGGLLILFSMLLSMFLWMDLTHIFTLILLATTLFLGVLGGVDDYLKIKHKNSKGLPGRVKLFCQFALGALLAAYLFLPGAAQKVAFGSWFTPPLVKEQILVAVADKLEPLQIPIALQAYASKLYIPFFKQPLVLGGVWTALAALLVLLVVAGSSNAVNLTDGLDGLAAGCLLMVSIGLAIIAFISNHIGLAGYLNLLYIEGSGEIAIYLSAFSGACLGFLWYNCHPAEMFMGDIGSLTLGGIIGVSAVLIKKELLLALIGGIFVLEALSVILQVLSYRLRNKKRIFLIAPLHHHFEYKGWPENKVVTRFWIGGLLLSMIGMASLKFH